LNYSQLVERIDQELREIREIVARTQQFIAQEQQPESIPFQEALTSAIALNLHSFYTGVERTLEAIARTVDGGIPMGEQWHRQLLEQMCVEINQVRPAVISESTRTRLDEFRRFRHLVRSLYAYRLERKRVIELAGQLQECSREFEQEIQQFKQFILKNRSLNS
jgi:hypothetical protein